MAVTTAATGLTVQQWDDKYFTEYMGNHPYKSYMGMTTGSIIQVKEDLTKKKGDSITYALVNKLTNAPNNGTSPLAGNEESLGSRSHQLPVSLRRNAVTVREFDEQISAIGLRNAGKDQLMEWSMEQDTDRISAALGSINGVSFAASTAGQRDTWLTNNADRALFGSAIANNAGNDHSASLANIDATNDRLTPQALSLMKRMALSANPKVRPLRVEGQNRRFFVVFANPLSFRDLKDNPTITQAQREVSVQMENNRLFKGGDIYWDGMIIHEVDDMPIINGAGAAGIDVGGVYLCGAQAIGLGMAKRWESREKKEDDYGNERGIGIRTIDGLQKLTFGTGAGDTDDLKDHGVVTGYFSAVADS